VIFTETPLAGAWLLEPERREDERGFFARTFCVDEFAAHGLDPSVVQCNVSHNRLAGTLRGLHLQAEPHAETKLVACSRGAIYDVIVDLRAGSPSFRDWHAVELSEADGRQLFVPKGMAHGFQTLVDGTEVRYQMGHRFAASHARGVRWDDPALGIVWPDPPPYGRLISERDLAYPDLDP